MENRIITLPEQFGPLQIRILSTGSLIAQPYAATLAADGAEVIQVERPGEGTLLAAFRQQLPTGRERKKSLPPDSGTAERILCLLD